jgi:hypothetical protein
MRLRGLKVNMKLNRGHFLASPIAVVATVALPIALVDATPAQVNTAWKQLIKSPRYFDVNESDTITDIENYYPLTSHFQQLVVGVERAG